MPKFLYTPLQARVFKERLRSDDTFQRCFTENITKDFDTELKSRDQMILWIFGLTGTGKTTVATEKAKDIDANFSANNIVFDNNELREKVNKSQPGDTFIRDETVKDFGEGRDQMLAEVQDMTETLRKRRNSFFLLAPVVKGIPFVNFYLEVLQSDVSLEHKALARLVKKGLKYIHFRVGIQSREGYYLGYIIVKSEVNNPIYTEYIKAKDRFLEEMASGSRVSGLDYEKEGRKILEKINLEKYRKKGERYNYIKMNTNFTMGQCRSIHIELERILREEGHKWGLIK